jgi:hypothetical protein
MTFIFFIFTTSSRSLTPENIEETLRRGRVLWDSIYEPHAEKLYKKLRSYHPDFIGELSFLWGYGMAWHGIFFFTGQQLILPETFFFSLHS